MAARLLVVVCAGLVFCSAGAQDSYNELSVTYRNGVDLAFDQLNAHAGVQHHFRFFKSLEKSEMETGFGVKFLYHHFYLRPTTCAKGTAIVNLQSCPFRKNRPLMDCAVCYKTSGDQIEAHPKPYVDCIQKPRFTEEMNTNRQEHCKRMTYNSGGPTLLAVSGDRG